MKTRRCAPRKFFAPYHERIDTEIKRRWRVRMPAVLISLHSFTPIFKGVARPWHVAVLYNRDPRLARHLLAMLKAETGLVVGNNEPYVVSNSTDYTIPVHGERLGLPHALIEIRQDLIAEERGQHTWALRLARLLPRALCGNGGHLIQALRHVQTRPGIARYNNKLPVPF